MTDPSEVESDLPEAEALTALEAAVAKYGPGDPIGRWGPVQAFKGRTVGEPCLAGFDLCDDYDVDSWLTEAKSWTQYAKALRDDNVVHEFGDDVGKWPKTARNGERAYLRARDIIAGDHGFFDSTAVATLQAAQRYAKVALELWTRAIEVSAGKDLDMKKYEELTTDTVTDPVDVPKVIPPPKLADLLPSVPTSVKVAGGVLVGLVALNLTANLWRK